MIDEEKLMTSEPSVSEETKEETPVVTPEVVEETKVEEAPAEEKGKKKKSKARKIVEWSLFGVFGVIFGVIIAGTISGLVHKDEYYGESIRFGIGTFVIQTSSMEPDIPTGAGVITYREDVNSFKTRLDSGETLDLTFKNVDDVNIPEEFEPTTPEFKYENGGRVVYSYMTMTHRLMEVHEYPTVAFGKGRYVFVTTGINNEGDFAKKGQYQVFNEKHYLGTVKVVSPFMGHAFNFITNPIGLIVLLLIPAGYLIVTSSIDIIKAMKESEAKEEAAAATSGDDRLSNLSAEDRERLKREMLDQMLEEKRGGKNDEDD